ncbi:hypothetical protein HMPREF3205_01436 [Streptococcus pasteurianus]|uniref:DUF1642 domain-containing protein n=1 Tax=Streptococcus pasteurianus TaxID=197614 RepID=UPI00076F9608|nr:DUF1642 domain-containing protein [Streptococcus pasteurianus]KXI12209.1 hypothetical protein HMPREF3205_01436 [Streptococcus pasteurianus]
MKKQEVIDEIENAIPDFILNDFQRGKETSLTYALELVEQLNDPEKPVVPQFVADWYEKYKNDFEYNLYRLCINFHERKLHEDLHEWFKFDKNKPIETLILMHKFGYEVEKEKLYTVKFANEDFGKIYIGIFKKFNKLGISSLPLNDDEIRPWFTEDELKRFKFWNNPAFEIEEVEK